MKTSLRSGSTLLELMLFLGILGIVATTLTSVYLATQETRVRQQYIAEVEQRGVLLLSTIGNGVRRAETILTPSTIGHTGAILVLQMQNPDEHPTIFAQSTSGTILLVQAAEISELQGTRTAVENFLIKRFGSGAVIVSFDVSTTIPTLEKKIYRKHFESIMSPLPDDRWEAGGCNVCNPLGCSSGNYRWNVCVSGTCSLATSTFGC